MNIVKLKDGPNKLSLRGAARRSNPASHEPGKTRLLRYARHDTVFGLDQRFLERPFPPTGARQAGVSLVELVVFILVAGIAGLGLMAAYTGLMRGPPLSLVNTVATQIAQERMELILARRRAVGFTAINDPCDPGPGPAICTALDPAYTILIPTIRGIGVAPANANQREIIVTVQSGGVTVMTLSTMVARY